MRCNPSSRAHHQKRYSTRIRPFPQSVLDAEFPAALRKISQRRLGATGTRPHWRTAFVNGLFLTAWYELC
jgi:hypothetical protein